MELRKLSWRLQRWNSNNLWIDHQSNRLQDIRSVFFNLPKNGTPNEGGKPGPDFEWRLADVAFLYGQLDESYRDSWQKIKYNLRTKWWRLNICRISKKKLSFQDLLVDPVVDAENEVTPDESGYEWMSIGLLPFQLPQDGHEGLVDENEACEVATVSECGPKDQIELFT